MPYVSHQAGSATGETYTYYEQERLAIYRNAGLARYKDVDAFFCKACELVVNVDCPNCHRKGATHLGAGETNFHVSRPLETRRYEWFQWTKVQCKECGYRFQVIVN